MSECEYCGKNLKDKMVFSCTKKQLITIKGELRNRISYSIDSENERCICCNVLKGSYHHKNCKEEVCPICKKKLIECSCKFVEKLDIPDYIALITYYELEEDYPFRLTFSITKIKDGINETVYIKDIYAIDKKLLPNNFEDFLKLLEDVKEEDIEDKSEQIEELMDNFFDLVEQYEIKNINNIIVYLYEDNNYEEFLSDIQRVITYDDYIRITCDNEIEEENRKRRLLMQISNISKDVKLIKLNNYTEEEYEKVKEISEDFEEFGESYEKWIENSVWIKEQLKKRGCLQ